MTPTISCHLHLCALSLTLSSNLLSSPRLSRSGSQLSMTSGLGASQQVAGLTTTRAVSRATSGAETPGHSSRARVRVSTGVETAGTCTGDRQEVVDSMLRTTQTELTKGTMVTTTMVTRDSNSSNHGSSSSSIPNSSSSSSPTCVSLCVKTIQSIATCLNTRRS